VSFSGDQTTFKALVAALDLIDAALATLEDAATSLERAAVGQVPEAAKRVIAAARIAQDAVAAAFLAIESTPNEIAVPSGDIASLVHWQRAQFATLDDLAGVSDQLRTLRAEARKRTQRTARIYEVRPGDTLESIAQITLGNAARASDLGLRDDQLEPGMVVRIPAS
jgi:hypothetical protein